MSLPNGLLDDVKEGQLHGFRSSRELFAAADRINAALQYVDASQWGNQGSPIQHVANRLGVSDSKARDLVSGARKAGYLSATAPGVSGGHLTPKGEGLARKLGLK